MESFWASVLPTESSNDEEKWSDSKSANSQEPSSLVMEESSSCKRKKTKISPAAVTHHSWEEVCDAYATLMQQKPSLSGRQFNKAVLELLHACIMLAQEEKSCPLPLPPPPPSSLPPPTMEWNFEQENFSRFRKLLLNKKELDSEQLVHQIVEWVNRSLSPNMPADEQKETLLKKSMAFVQELSPAIAIKTAPMIKSCVAQLFDSQLDNLFAEIHMPEMTIREKSLMYRRMLSNFLDDATSVCFAFSNKQLLGRLQPKDLYFLTFFACVTARRARGDNLLQLGCVGKPFI